MTKKNNPSVKKDNQKALLPSNGVETKPCHEKAMKALGQMLDYLSTELADFSEHIRQSPWSEKGRPFEEMMKSYQRLLEYQKNFELILYGSEQGGSSVSQEELIHTILKKLVKTSKS